jgi:membrane protease YdiL (CAAX protease family)
MADPKDQLRNVLKAFSIELPIYAILVVAYGSVVLHFLAHPLSQLFASDRRLYAVVALVLIVAQGYILEILARGLLALIKRNGRK